MASIVILGKESLSLDSVNLGRLVVNIAHPQDDYYDPPPAAELTPIITDYKGCEGLHNSDRGDSFFLKLTSFVSLGRSKRHGFVSQVDAKCGRHYGFNNSAKYFRDIIQLTETREWIETKLKEGQQIYLLIGYSTFQDADVIECENRFTSKDISLTAPLSSLVPLSVGVPIPVPALIPGADVLDPSTGGSINRADAIRSKFTVEGEQVFALEYRKVNITLRKFKHGEVGKLRDRQWKVLTRHRHAHKPETEDVVEADVNESGERDNFEFDEDDDDEEWTKLADEDGDFYL